MFSKKIDQPSTLSELVQNNDLPILKHAIEKAKEDAKRYTWCNDKNVEAAITEAIRLNNLEALKCFTSSGYDSDKLVTQAAGLGQLDIIKYLIEDGAIIQEDEDYEALFAAIDAGHPDIVDFLAKEYGMGIHEFYTHDFPEYTWPSDTFLVRAALSNNHRTIDVLLQHDVPIIRALNSFKAIHKLLNESFSEIKKQLAETSTVSDAKQLEVTNEMGNAIKKFSEDEQKAIRILMDYAVGENFIMQLPDYPGISFLKSLDTIAGINFIGVSVNDCPVTHPLLAELKLPGAEDAIVTLSELAVIPDETRRQAIQNRLEIHLKKQESLIDEETQHSLRK